MFPTPTLTQIIVNPHHPRVERDLADTHRMHQQMLRLCCRDDFGPGSRAAAGVLYRVDTTHSQTAILVQSLTAPDTSTLPSGYDHAQTKDLEPLLNRLANGSRVRYRIACAPSRAKHINGKRSGKRYGLSGEDAARWWKRAADKAGLALESTHICDERRLSGRSRGRDVPLHWMVQFDGTATITNPDTTREAVTTGIGPGKAYGCGLLSLAITA